MVAKISLGNSLYGAINYNGEKINKEKGRLLDTNKIYNDGTGSVDVKRAFADFMQWMPSTTKTERPMVHISLNPHPDDVLTDAQLTDIAREYMEKMGFGDMPYMVYKHTDINRHHMHIVALRVRTDGSCVSDKNNFYRSKEITRELEKKYGLKTAEREKVTPETPLLKIDPTGDLKRQVAAVVKIVGMRYRFQTLGEYNAVLGLFNVKCENTDGNVNGREYHGLVYFAIGEDGQPIAAPFKASRLGKFAGREAIDAKYEKSKEKIDVSPTKQVVESVMSNNSDKNDFIRELKARNIDVIFRYTDEGRIYGVTFIDHNTFNVMNGSRLGKAFSANAFEAKFDRIQTELNGNSSNDLPTDVGMDNSMPIIPQTAPVNSLCSGSQGTQGGGHSNTSIPNTSKRYDKESDISIPGLDLFQSGMSYNPDEEEFARRMKRKRKKGPGHKF